MRLASFTFIAGLVACISARDVLFYKGSGCSEGEFVGCYDITTYTCCITNEAAAAVSVFKDDGSELATMWSGGGCNKQQCLGRGPSGLYCCVAGRRALFTGGMVFRVYGPKQEQQPQQEQQQQQQQRPDVNCTKTMQTNVFGYTSEKHGTWAIRTDHLQAASAVPQKDAFGHLHNKFAKVAAEDKIAWLQAHGAVYKPQLHGEEVTTGFTVDGAITIL